MTKAQDPQAWQSLSDAIKLTGDNQATLAACRKAAAKTKKGQRCTLMVPVTGDN